MDELERRVIFESGHDCMRFECVNGREDCSPNAPGSHGVEGVKIRFLLLGPKGAVHFVLSLGWTPFMPGEEFFDWRDRNARTADLYPLPLDLGYHSPEPKYEGQESRKCDALPGGECFGDGSGLNANMPFATLCNGGDEALWKYLEQYYRHEFEGGDWPEVIEYPHETRAVVLR